MRKPTNRGIVKAKKAKAATHRPEVKFGGMCDVLEKYLFSVIELGLVERPQPDSPRLSTRKYRLAAKGIMAFTPTMELDKGEKEAV